MDDELQAAYLDRLGLEAEPPSIDALQRLHRRQVERVPYETMWIHAGEAWGIDPRRLGRRGSRCRGGAATASISTARSASCCGRSATPSRAMSVACTARAALMPRCSRTISSSPSRSCPRPSIRRAVWYVDAGLGDALYEALPLTAGALRPGPVPSALERDGRRRRRLAPDPRPAGELHRDELADGAGGDHRRSRSAIGGCRRRRSRASSAWLPRSIGMRRASTSCAGSC